MTAPLTEEELAQIRAHVAEGIDIGEPRAEQMLVTIDRQRALLADKDAELDRVRALLGKMLLIIDQGIPAPCGYCGTPDAQCDADCATVAYMSQDILEARRLAEGCKPEPRTDRAARLEALLREFVQKMRMLERDGYDDEHVYKALIDAARKANAELSREGSYG
jgi:hypothetical protein